MPGEIALRAMGINVVVHRYKRCAAGNDSVTDAEVVRNTRASGRPRPGAIGQGSFVRPSRKVTI
jgi:hypothetical protein